MANTYTLIASSTVGSGGASSITFSSIPATYTDLKVVFSLRSDWSSDPYDYFVQGIQFNGTTSTYSTRILYGNGSSAASGSDSSTGLRQSYYNAGTSTSSTFANGEMYIPNYTSSNYKSTSIDQVTENNATASIAGITAGLWSNTSAITQIVFLPRSGSNFVQYSTAYLYGINNS